MVLSSSFALTLDSTPQDNETYKTTTRAQLKSWHSLVANRKGQEWLLVHVVKADLARGAASGAGRFFGVGGSVIDKIRSDLNLGKRDRCVSSRAAARQRLLLF